MPEGQEESRNTRPGGLARTLTAPERAAPKMMSTTGATLLRFHAAEHLE
jgi:hypothetical protein